jgi:hypothetical protein
MSFVGTLATTQRVLSQPRRDPRTVAMLLVVPLVMVWVLDLSVAGPTWLLVAVAVVDAVLGCALGLFVSAFARTEFQAVQFLPAVVLPTLGAATLRRRTE